MDDVDAVAKLVADAAFVLDAVRPGHDHALTSAAEVRGDLLGPLVRGVEGPGPAHGHVVIGLVGAPVIMEVFELRFAGGVTPLNCAASFGVPMGEPSVLEPLSPTIQMIRVLSSLPMSLIASITRPVSWSQ